ncbi:tRNA (adenosine(37)-N6)-threonylcarbamoyltransferase complex ATPase subunit type 1 TsaE [Luteimonas kalidii]|uniref:tRNA threonylcarbamoyladenosine biosynthesis protein TsaE n=1 Tax=Luteimonas kalidii TaxID=3042025 RepID=A0ABT6JTL7_9GAMM|nr:tRNA (adenosine(37)-N6)-threonylcarbamoyltransferase complex ATPase subunit type 1 TsaE [Luteimonas kalidii]MDH5834034.1 tRNA (adenosine(37)-N6)-threonylcarbamoyltransferase complex ATPase subunit type 1 TsaE [Luteimonas kalidii]
MMELSLPDEPATRRLAAALAQSAPARAVVHLHGDLGAGKSTLARAWLRTLGVTGTVRSPTYTLVERYPLARGGEALHLDLYRIGDAAELEFLGLDEAEAALWLVEWPERGASALPPPDLDVHLGFEGTGRAARLSASTPTGTAWLATLRDMPQLHRIAEPNP